MGRKAGDRSQMKINTKKNFKRLTVMLAACVLCFLGMLSFHTKADAATALTIAVGKTASVSQASATYSSANRTIACVNSEGRVTAKKVGSTVIRVVSGGTTTSVPVTVVANEKKPTIAVCADEISIAGNKVALTPIKKTVYVDKIKKDENGDAQLVKEAKEVIVGYKYQASLTVKNYSGYAAKNVVFRAKVGSNQQDFNFGSVAAGETKTVTNTGTVSKKVSTIKLLRKRVYTGEMVCAYHYRSKSTLYFYATPDKTAPVISGFVGSNSYNQDMPYQVVYSDDTDYDFFKYVSATDDRDTKVSLTVDTSKVNFKKTGTYTVTYTAKDKAGNTSTATAKIGIRVATDLDDYASTILKKIIKDNSWSDIKKATAIYNYTRGHISYVGYSNKSSWEKEAVRGIRYGVGDCFTYYALSRALLTRAGIPNIMVKRVKPNDQGHTRHWWNMVYIESEDAFYHFDTCPRSLGGRFCLLTDAQLTEYSNTHGHSHIWDYDNIPKSGTNKISSGY
jgi:hypothetical protein